jgi:hypothetical protein
LKPQIHVNTNGRRRDGQRPYQTTSGPPSSMSRRSNSTGPPRRSETLRFSITPDHPGSSTLQIKTAATALKAPPGQIGPTAPLAARIKTQTKTKLEARPGKLASPISGTRVTVHDVGKKNRGIYPIWASVTENLTLRRDLSRREVPDGTEASQGRSAKPAGGAGLSQRRLLAIQSVRLGQP